MSDRLSWGFALSSDALPLLRRLLEQNLIDRIASPADGSSWQAGEVQTLLSSEWARSQAFVAVGACGAITRLIAPLLAHKHSDPAVVVVDPQGRYAVPLVGGHAGGAEQLAERIAAILGGRAVITGGSGARGLLALDSFGERWGWRRGAGPWDALMKSAARSEPVQLEHRHGNARWLELDDLPARGNTGLSLQVSVEKGDGCRWHPPALWVGMGCERGTSVELLERALQQALAEPLPAGPALITEPAKPWLEPIFAAHAKCTRRLPAPTRHSSRGVHHNCMQMAPEKRCADRALAAGWCHFFNLALPAMTPDPFHSLAAFLTGLPSL